MPDENNSPSDTLNKLSAALVQISRGDPLVALRNELQTRFLAIDRRFEAIDKATELQHEDMVRVPTQVDKAVGSVREVLEQTMQTRFDAIEQRLSAMDRATELQHEDMVRVPTLLDKAMASLEDLFVEKLATAVADIKGQMHSAKAETAEKFSAVAAQFTERDTRTDQRAGDTKLAVDAAFAAAKEATAKIEAGFTKQIDQTITNVDTKTLNLDRSITDIKNNFNSSINDIKDNFNGAINDIKNRLTSIESRTVTTGQVGRETRDTRREGRENMTLIFVAVAILISLAALFSHGGIPVPVIGH
jgi:hypothetical protein